MNEDEALLIALATPAGIDDALNLLEHPLLKAAKFCEARTHVEFYRRLAGSLRKAYQMEVDSGRA